MNLNRIVKNIQKNLGKDSIRLLTDGALDCDRISSQSVLIDRCLGGGFPLGRVIEIYGNEGSGKTTLCMHLLAECQRIGGISVMIDLENCYSVDYSKELGVDVDKLIISQPNSGDEAFRIAKALMVEKGAETKSEVPLVIVFDSVAALASEDELSGEVTDHKYAPVARLMSQSLRRLTRIIAETNTLIVFTNQMREKVGVVFGRTEDSTGGKALKYYASVRLEMSRGKLLNLNGTPYGQLCKIKIVKNKTYKPFQECLVAINWGKGIDLDKSLLDLAISEGVIEKRAAIYIFGDRKFRGEQRILSEFSNNNLKDAIRGELNEIK